MHLKKIIPTAGAPYLVNRLMDSMGVLKQDALPLLQSQSLFPSVPQPVICAVWRLTVIAFLLKTASVVTESLEVLQQAL